MSQLIDLSSKSIMEIFIYVKEKLTQIQKKVLISKKDKIIFISSSGEIYANGKEPINVF
jgi:hypothetical protein